MEKETFFQKIKRRIDEWASDDFFVPTFVLGTGMNDEVLSHLSLESIHSETFLADRDTTSLKPDLLIIVGFINYKNLKNVLTEYNKLVGRKYVVVIGPNADVYQLNSYNLVLNLEDYIPVDLHIAGNPPSRQEIISGLSRLKDIRR